MTLDLVNWMASNGLKLTKQFDVGLLTFDKDNGKALLPEALITDIIKLGWKYFQNNESPFLSTNNRVINNIWFKKKLENGHGDELARS